jgi:P4 family phage/plasmid primase-like protien
MSNLELDPDTIFNSFCPLPLEIKTKDQKLEYFIDSFDRSYEYMSDKNWLYIWNGKIWKPHCPEEFTQFIKPKWKEMCGTGFCEKVDNEVRKQLVKLGYKDISEIEQPKNMVCCNNGVYDLEAKRLLPHNRDFYFTYMIELNYKPDSHPKLWITTMEQCIPNEEDRDYIISYSQLAMTPSIDYQIMMIWLGPPASGKTKYSEFLIHLIGKPAGVSSMSRMSEEGGVVDLKDKTLLVLDEIGGHVLSHGTVERYKRLVTNKYLNGRRKYEKQVFFTNTCKIVCITNKMNQIQDEYATGLFRRVKIVVWDQCFNGDERDKTRFERIFELEAEEVLSYILDYEPKWDYTVNPEETEKMWMLGDPINKFLEEWCVKVDTADTPTNDVYDAYTRFCKVNKMKTVEKRYFRSQMAMKGHGATEIDKSTNYYVFKGINLLENYDVEMIK